MSNTKPAKRYNALDHIMGVNEAAILWGSSPQYIKVLCERSRIRAVKIGKTWVIDKDQPNPKRGE